MKKTLLVFAILSIAVLALGMTSPALAATPLRGGPGNGCVAGGNGSGGNGHQGALGTGTGVPIEQNIALDGVLSDLIHDNLATALGISSTDLAERLEDGETISQIVLSLGSDLDISETLTQARIDAMAQGVETGLITQEQAHWRASRGTPAAGYGDGICDGTGDCINDS